MQTHKNLFRLRAGRALALLTLGLLLAVTTLRAVLPGVTQANNVLTFAPEADATVKVNHPDERYGTREIIEVDAQAPRFSYLRFNVSGVGQNQVVKARLRLFVYKGHSTAAITAHATSNEWDEASITWNNQPQPGPAVGQWPSAPLHEDTWIEIDVTPAVQGDGVYSFVLTSDSSDHHGFRSREHRKHPQLILDVAPTAVAPTATSAPTTAPTATVEPTTVPTATVEPTTAPTTTVEPTTAPTTTVEPTQEPTATVEPTQEPTQEPTATVEPTQEPTQEPTSQPAPAPEGPAVAFPGAEGFGTETVGGRGGRIIYVTNLNDSGAGSLRAALEASGPRIVLFKVAGTIDLQNDISITNPYITIAGQTAPGEGVQVRNAMIEIETHDVIMRYLKLRPGDQPSGSAPENRDALSMRGLKGNEIYNVVVDHCTLIWGPDIGGPAMLSNSHDVTISNSIIGEGLYLSSHPEGTESNGGHAMGLNITQLDPAKYGGTHPQRITLHHNLLTSANQRMPQVMAAEYVDIVNNVIYNWGGKAAHGNPRKLNLINNTFIKGSMSRKLAAWTPDGNSTVPDLFPQSVFEQGNVTVGFDTVRDDPYEVYASSRFDPYSIQTEQTAEESYNRVIEDAGASLPLRDSVDQRIIDNVVNRTGGWVSGSDLVWPELQSGPVPADADNDGMADEWEQQHFGDTSRGSANDSSGDFDGDGYTDVEEYIYNTDPTQ